MQTTGFRNEILSLWSYLCSYRLRVCPTRCTSRAKLNGSSRQQNFSAEVPPSGEEPWRCT